jgi:hypothetical protein
VRRTDGSFQLWGANLEGPLSDWNEFVEWDGEAWVLSEASGLVQRANVQAIELYRPSTDWQLRYVAAASDNSSETGDVGEVILQIAPMSDQDVETALFSFLASVDYEGSVPVGSVEVLGSRGIAYEEYGSDSDAVLWADGAHRYWLRADSTTGMPTTASAVVERMSVNESRSLSTVHNPPEPGALETFGFRAMQVAALLIGLSSVFFIWRGPRRLALIGLAIPVAIIFASNRDVHWFAAGSFALLAFVWWYRLQLKQRGSQLGDDLSEPKAVTSAGDAAVRGGVEGPARPHQDG